MSKKIHLTTLTLIAERTPVSIGCHYADESRCHRWRLLRIIQNHAASHSR
jgi:hypothetical protein